MCRKRSRGYSTLTAATESLASTGPSTVRTVGRLLIAARSICCNAGHTVSNLDRRLIFARTVDEFRRLAREANIDVKKNGATLLHTFCSLGRVDLVEYLLGRVGVPQTQNLNTRQTPLHCTLDCSNDADQDRKRCHILRLLLNSIRGGVSRPDINARDINGWTPLKMACRAGLVECARYLLRSGANVDIRDKEGFGAIHDAVGHPNVIAELIPYYDNVNVATFHHETPLLLAVKQGEFNTVRRLVHSGANVNKEDVFDVFPLLAAARLRDTNILQVLIDSHANIDAQEPKKGQTALHEIAEAGCIAPALVLIKGGARHDIKNEEGKTAYECALANSVELAKAMRAAFQERGIFLPSEETLEHVAVKEAFVLCASGSPDQLVAHLKENNVAANVNLKRRTLVHCAVENFRLDVLHVLSQLGADIGAINDVRNTYLHLACCASQDHEKSFRILQYLLTHKIPINSQNEAGETPLFAAANDGLARHVDLLLRSGASPDIRNCKGGLPLHASCTSPTCSLECAELLLWASPRAVNRMNDKGWTALMCAVKSNAVDIARLLVAKKADVNVQPKSGREDTALFLAVEAKSYDLCQLLVEHGAKINVTVGRRKISPFHQVAMSSDQDPVLKDICRLFARHGGDLTKKDLHGNSVLSLVEKAFKEKLKVCAEEGPLPKERGATQSPATSSTETILPRDYDDPLSIQNKRISFGRTTSDPSNSRALEQLSSPPVLPVTAAGHRRDSADGGGANSTERSNLLDFIINADEYSQVYSTAQQQKIHPGNPNQFHRINEKMDRKALLPHGQFYKSPNDLSHLSAVEIPEQKPLSRLEKLKNDNCPLEKCCAELQDELQKFQADKDEDRRRCTRLEQQLFDKSQTMAEVTKSHERQRENLEKFCQVLKQQIYEKNEEIGQITKEYEEQRKELERRLQDQEDSSRSLELQYSEEIAKLTEICVKQREEIDRTERERSSVSQKSIEELTIDPEAVELSTTKLGSGAYGGRFKMRVAVKKFHDLITTPRTRPQFEREVLVCSRLRHPNIVSIFGAVIAEDCPFQIVMELLEGSVVEVIDAAHKCKLYLSEYEQLFIATKIASAISYLHQLRPKPYLHCDIRSSNVMVANDMDVKVGDLGAAHVLESSLSIGPLSPPYLAPERMQYTDGTPGARSSLQSDVYSLGVTFVEIFTGRGPIAEERAEQVELVKSEDVRGICSAMVDERPQRRPSALESFQLLTSKLLSNRHKVKRRVKSNFGHDGRHSVSLSAAFY